MRTKLMLVMLLVATGPGCGQPAADDPGPGPKGRLLLVAAEGLVEAGQEYAEFRRQGGFEVAVLSTAEIQAAHPDLALDQAIAAEVRAFDWSAEPPLDPYLLLLGDADAADPAAPGLIPVVVASGQGEGFSWSEVGDSPYGDLDLDGIPDIAIGRLPFREPAQLAAYQARAGEYEQGYTPGPFNKTLAAFAGQGGFGPEIDGLLEMATGWVFDEMSYDFDMSMTYAADSSAYYLPADQWQADYAARYQAGAVLMPYIGHTLTQAACCGSEPPARRGLLAFFSCSDGSFQDGGEADPAQSLAERVLLDPNGPIASLGATDVSHPYGNAILPRELGHAILDLREPTYGLALTVAKRNAVERIDDLRQTIDAAAAPYTDEPLDQLILSHIVLYNLLGDPTLPLHLPPGEVYFARPDSDPAPGQTLHVTGQVRGGPRGAPTNGRIAVTLEVHRTVVCHELVPRDPADHDPATCQANHAAANDKVLVRAEGPVESGTFALDLTLPADLTEPSVYLKGYAFDEQTDAIGSRLVHVAQVE